MRIRILGVLLLVLIAAGQPSRSLTVIAHRGASWDAPEHTFAAWDLAIAQGADWIEQDLQFTRDQQLIVFHDDTLERTATGEGANCVGPVRARSLAELQRCEVGSWFNRAHPERADPAFARERVPTLDSVLTRYAGRARFYIETKRPDEAPGMEDSLVALLRRRGLVDRRDEVMLQSFSAASLQRLRALAPTLRRVQLLEDPIPRDSLDAAMTAIAAYADGIGPSRRIVTPQMIEAAHRRGLVVHVYTVNDRAVMRWMRDAGVDGLFTDRPAELRDLLSR